jgi:CubicO group peptidase (beta-lactamase class C family)
MDANFAPEMMPIHKNDLSKDRSLLYLFLFCVFQLLAASHLLADSVDDYVRQQMNAQHIPGIVLVVLKDGKVTKQQAYGLANVELGVPTSLDSVFPLASVTKVFTSTAVYLLVQDKKIHLEDKVTQALPGLPDSWNEITVLNCLTHTSGLVDIFPGSPAAAPADWVAAATQEEALKKVSGKPLLNKPGEKSAYNQTEFLLLKMMVERASGMPLEEFLNKRIFVPLGMTSARFGDSLDIVPKRVALYMNFIPQADRFHVERQPNGNGLASPDGKLWNNINFLYPEYQHGGVALNMNAKDLATFDMALNNGQVLDRRTLDLMWTPFRLNNGRYAEFAGGWDTDDLNGHRLIFHIGAGMVEYARLADVGLTVIILTNNQGFNPYRLTIGIMRFFTPALDKRRN